MSSSPPLWLSETDCAALVSLEDVIDVLEQALRLEAAGEAQSIPKAMGRWGDGAAMHSLGAFSPALGFVGWKTWAITKGGGAVTYELFDAATGALKAVMQAITLGQMRTAAMSGLGTRWMSAPGADSLAIVGAGRQALAQVAAVAAVRPLRKVSVYSRSAERREAFAATLRGQFAFEVEIATALEAAVGEAAIVTTVTRAQEPFLHAAGLARGAHLNAVGAILPTHAEFFGEVFDRADLIAVDSVADARKVSREVIDREAGSGPLAILPLSDLVAGKASRPADPDLTIFKSLGMGLSDLCVAAEIFRRAVDRGVGAPLAVSAPAPIRWA